MNWISNVVRPKIRSFLRRETPENLWIKCPETGQLVFYKDVEANQFVIPELQLSHAHRRRGAAQVDVRRRRPALDIARAGGAGRSAQVPRRAPLRRPPEGRAHQDRPARRGQARHRQARRPAGGHRACRISISWAARSAWRRRGGDHRAGDRGAPADAVHHVRGLRRRAHAGRHPLADAVAAHHRRGADAARGEEALHRGARPIRPPAASPPPTPCSATCRSPSRAR